MAQSAQIFNYSAYANEKMKADLPQAKKNKSLNLVKV